MMDEHKVKVILDWEPPKSVPALISFLGLASYCRKFIKNFAKIAGPLTNLLKKSAVTYDWVEACEETFETQEGKWGLGSPPRLPKLQGSKHLALRHSLYHWKVIEV